MLYIFRCTEDGIRCEMIERYAFDEWIREHTEDIKLEYYPKFIDTFPNHTNHENEYFMIEGKFLIPKPITVVKSYTL